MERGARRKPPSRKSKCTAPNNESATTAAQLAPLMFLVVFCSGYLKFPFYISASVRMAHELARSAGNFLISPRAQLGLAHWFIKCRNRQNIF